MEKIFLSYHFDEEIKPAVQNIKRLIESHDLSPIDGKRLQGMNLPEAVKQEIAKSDAMVILMNKREEGLTNEWIQFERTIALALGIPFIAIVEIGVPNNGPFQSYEYLNYSPNDFIETILSLSETIFKWKISAGKSIEAVIEPEEAALAIRNNISMEDIVRYRFFDPKLGLQHDWKKPVIRPLPGRLSILLRGIKKDSEIQVCVRTNEKQWQSDLINQNLTVRLR